MPNPTVERGVSCPFFCTVAWGMGWGVYGDGFVPGWCGGVFVIDESGPVVMEEGRRRGGTVGGEKGRGEARRREATRGEARAVSFRRSAI